MNAAGDSLGLPAALVWVALILAIAWIWTTKIKEG